MNKSYVVYGPQGCGKTRNAKRIAKALGLNAILDDFDGKQPLPRTDTLALTNVVPPRIADARRVLSFEQAMCEVARHERTQGATQ